MSWTTFLIIWVILIILGLWWNAERQRKKVLELLDDFLVLPGILDLPRKATLKLEDWVDANV